MPPVSKLLRRPRRELRLYHVFREVGSPCYSRILVLRNVRRAPGKERARRHARAHCDESGRGGKRKMRRATEVGLLRLRVSVVSRSASSSVARNQGLPARSMPRDTKSKCRLAPRKAIARRPDGAVRATQVPCTLHVRQSREKSALRRRELLRG